MRTVAVVALGLLGTLPAGPVSAGSYSNARYGYTIRYPGQLVPEQEAANGDGRSFNGRGSDARFTVFARSRLPGDTPATVFAEGVPECGHTPPSYRLVRGNLMAVSCLHGGRIFYRKTLIGRDALTTLTAEYAAAERSLWDPVVSGMAGSMTPATR